METILVILLVAAVFAVLRSAFRAPLPPQIIYVQTLPPEPERAGVGCLTIVVVFMVLLAVVRVLAV